MFWAQHSYELRLAPSLLFPVAGFEISLLWFKKMRRSGMSNDAVLAPSEWKSMFAQPWMSSFNDDFDYFCNDSMLLLREGCHIGNGGHWPVASIAA